MTALTNFTPFVAKHIPCFDEKSQQLSVLALSATFEASPSRHPHLAIAEVQMPVHDSDVCRGEPGLSSVVYEGEVAWHKPRVDVLVNGSAYAPAGRRVAIMPVALKAADIDKVLQVCGDREWRMNRAGAPEPFERMPLIYERAFGGTTAKRADLRNPIGVGFDAARSASPDVATQLPNVEYPNELIHSTSDTPRPAGFAVCSRGWQPRLRYSGTYDTAWLARHAPLLPPDFDTQHFQAAPADQQSTTLAGGAPVTLMNMTPEGSWSFVLPTLCVPIRFRYADRVVDVPLRTDTVLIEPDHKRVVLIARCVLALQRNRAPLVEIIVGDVSPGWLWARRRGKPYWGAHAAQGGGGPKREVVL